MEEELAGTDFKEQERSTKQWISEYRSIKLTSHAMKFSGRVVEARLRGEVNICEQQMNMVSSQRQVTQMQYLLQGCWEKKIQWQGWGKNYGMYVKYVRVVQGIYENCKTMVGYLK